jgi:hypothetical protein
MSAARKLFCSNPDCGQQLLSTFTSCPSCGGSSFSENAPTRPLVRAVPVSQRQTVQGGTPAAYSPAPRPTHLAPAVTPLGRVNAVPDIERNSTNIVSKTEAERDRIYDALLAACGAEGVEGMVLKSHPFSPMVWVSCECWLPHERDNRLRERVSAVLTIRGREYHRFEYEIDIEIKRGNETQKLVSVISFPAESARMLVQYLLHRRDNCEFDRCRTAPLQLWLPKNKIARPSDPLEITAGVMWVVGFATIALQGIGVIFLLIGAGLTFVVHYRRKKLYVVSTGKPAEEPRKLLRMDSWQTLVNDLGGEAERVKSEIRTALRPAQRDGARLSDEKIWYRGVDGKEEREQLVVTFRRAIAFIHVYAYGNDLYVGWDAHVNGGTWIETRVGFGVDPQTQARCQLNSIAAGWHTPNEYDVNDTETLIERVHAAVTQMVKRIIAEHKIDQDIDFQILRGGRQGIIGHADIVEAKPQSRFQRHA